MHARAARTARTGSRPRSVPARAQALAIPVASPWPRPPPLRHAPRGYGTTRSSPRRTPLKGWITLAEVSASSAPELEPSARAGRMWHGRARERGHSKPAGLGLDQIERRLAAETLSRVFERHRSAARRRDEGIGRPSREIETTVAFGSPCGHRAIEGTTFSRHR